MDEFLIKKAQDRVNYGVGRIKAENKIKASIPKPRSISEVAIERMAEKELEKIAPSTGYPDLDRIIKGFVPGHLYTLTGNENVGKTSLACNFAVRVAKQEKKVLYFALEPENVVVDYVASVRFDKKFEDLTEEETGFDDGNIHVFGKEEVNKVDDLVKIVQHSERYDLIVIDHIGYFIHGEGQNTNTEQSNAIKKLAGLAKSKKTAIVIIAHLRKPPNNSRKNYIPTSNDISGSGSFKQDSTEVMIVVRNLADPEAGGLEYADDGNLFVTKTKAGANGFIQLMFSERKANIVSAGELIEINREKQKEAGYRLVEGDKKW
uniref:Putative helicase n=1 Tax=viral metagenome TaxID=1070528 RepID=A0A6M3IFS2_9ZZZZ